MASFTDSAGASQTCELADLLVVLDDLTSTTAAVRKAALIQAKMANVGGGKTLSQSNDLKQLNLLSNWPIFFLSSGFNAGSRDFSTCTHSGHAIDCGRYGLIELNSSPKWVQHAPSKTMGATGDELGTFLAQMMTSGSTGYGRDATGTGDDWSMTVQELLTKTGADFFTLKRGFNGQQQRGNVKFAFSAPDPAIFRSGPTRGAYADFFIQQLDFFSGGDDPPDSPDGDGGPVGVSLLHIALLRLPER